MKFIYILQSVAVFKGADPCNDSSLATSLRCGQTLSGNLGRIINLSLFIIGMTAVIIILFQGFRYVLSKGDPKAVEAAKNGIVYASIGLVVSLLAWGLVRFVLAKVLQ